LAGVAGANEALCPDYGTVTAAMPVVGRPVPIKIRSDSSCLLDHPTQS
jgi:hypothetical protein